MPNARAYEVARKPLNIPADALGFALFGVLVAFLAFCVLAFLSNVTLTFTQCKDMGSMGSSPCTVDMGRAVLMALGLVALASISLIVRKGAEPATFSALVWVGAMVSRHAGRIDPDGGGGMGDWTVPALGSASVPTSLSSVLGGGLETAVLAVAVAGLVLWLFHRLRSHSGQWILTAAALLIGTGAGTAAGLFVAPLVLPHLSATRFIQSVSK